MAWFSSTTAALSCATKSWGVMKPPGFRAKKGRSALSLACLKLKGGLHPALSEYLQALSRWHGEPEHSHPPIRCNNKRLPRLIRRLPRLRLLLAQADQVSGWLAGPHELLVATQRIGHLGGAHRRAVHRLARLQHRMQRLALWRRIDELRRQAREVAGVEAGQRGGMGEQCGSRRRHTARGRICFSSAASSRRAHSSS